ncbi:hypothetical protein [Labedaea rhizosphaerae]|nr:hypothetical protein [Labedaea rhizosphaerae]
MTHGDLSGEMLHKSGEMDVFGISNWHGSQHLQFFEVDSNQNIVEIWLAHRSEPNTDLQCPTRHVMVGSFDPAIGQRLNLEEYVVQDAVTKVVSSAVPRKRVNKPIDSGSRRAVFHHIQQVTASRGTWPLTDVSVDGVQVPCRVWSFAMLTVGFCPPVEEHPFVFIASRFQDVTALQFRQLVSTEDYEFDMTAGIRRADIRWWDESPVAADVDYLNLYHRDPLSG